ncbi:MAG: fluoride efflux transporter CrcB [Phycisphaerales bacterium]
MMLILWVAVGGALGAVGRYLLTALINQAALGPWKLGTLSVNLIGCFLFGLVWAKADLKLQLEGPVAIALLGGFLGAFTTFSTFAFQTVALARQGDYVWAAVNLLAHNGLGIVMVFAGLAAAGGLTPHD